MSLKWTTNPTGSSTPTTPTASSTTPPSGSLDWTTTPSGKIPLDITPAPSYISRVISDVAQLPEKLNARVDAASGSIPNKLAQGFGAVSDVLGTALAPINEVPIIKDNPIISSAVMGAAAGSRAGVPGAIAGGVAGAAFPVLQEKIANITQSPEYKQIAQAHPEVASSLEAAGNYINSVFQAEMLRGAKNVAVATPDIAKAGIAKVQDLQAKRADKALSKSADEVFNIESNYAKLRDKNLYSKDNGVASRQRIAESNVLVDTVGTDGKITPEGIQSAVEKYKAQTIDGAEGVVRTNLANEGATVNINEVVKFLRDSISASKLPMGDIGTALKSGVQAQVAGLMRKADEFGNIKLTDIHDAKINEASHINFQTPPETATYRKAIAAAYKKIVEEKSSTNVREVNAELSKYYGDIQRIENLRGRRVAGGKIGKYTAQIGGNIAGGLVGHAFGPLGSAVGTVVGGEVASAIKGKQMASTFGKDTGTRLAKSPILESAKQQAAQPKKVDLTIPDKKIGAGKSVTKTKEILKIEKNIRDNVEAQKKAIKAKDFSLVAQLKETYTVLVESLKNAIQKMKSLPRNRGMIKNPLSTSPKAGKQQVKHIQSVPSKDTTTSTGNLSSKKIPTNRGFIAAYKETGDLTTKLLKDLEGKTTVSKQYILDATNRPELKQTEKDVIRAVLEGEGDKINVADFANKVKAELLPLKVNSTRTEQITRAKAKKELEKIGVHFEKDMSGEANMVDKNGDFLEYDSLDSRTKKLVDVATGDAETFADMSSGSAKYESVSLPDSTRGNIKNYFEHIYESPIKTSAGDTHFAGRTKNYFGHTRIEDMADDKTRRVIEVQSDLYQKGNLEKEVPTETIDEGMYFTKDENGRGYARPIKDRVAELSKLAQYSNPTAHFRMVREEIKRASQDGKTKLQFPTGETAMKIEGLGDSHGWVLPTDRTATPLKPEQLKIGGEIQQMHDFDKWIITDVLGDGKFKAVPKRWFDAAKKDTGRPDNVLFSQANNQGATEQFDISGKVDTNNPIYKFYEKDLAKYLNKYGAKRVTDSKGVTWYEIPITKEQGTAPVEAFGKVKVNPLFAGAGLSAGIAGGAQVYNTNKKK